MASDVEKWLADNDDFATAINVRAYWKLVLFLPLELAQNDMDVLLTAGLYCKWLVRASSDVKQLQVEFLDAVIPLVSEHCDYDGLVIYNGDSTMATRHGECSGTGADNSP